MVLRWWFPCSSTFLYLLSQPFHVSFLPSFLPEAVAVAWERRDTQRAKWRWTAMHYPSRSRYHLLKRLSSLQQCKSLFIQALSPGSLCLSLILVGAARLFSPLFSALLIYFCTWAFSLTQFDFQVASRLLSAFDLCAPSLCHMSLQYRCVFATFHISFKDSQMPGRMFQT